MLFSNPFKTRMPLVREALPGRDMPVWNGAPHAVLGTPTMPPVSCWICRDRSRSWLLWGAGEIVLQLEGVHTTAVGYAGGLTPIPPMRRSVRDRPAIPRLFLWSMTRW